MVKLTRSLNIAMTITTNKYLEKIAALHFPVINPIRTVNPVKGIANTVGRGGVKGSVFGRTMKPGTKI